MNLSDIKFNYYPSKVWIQEPLGTITLEQFLSSIRSPKPEIKEVFNKISEAASKGDLKTKDNLKQNNLFYVTPSVQTNGKGRKLEDITEINPIMICEFDKIDYAEGLKRVLFDKMSCILAAYTSPSKKGTKIIVRIPKVKTVEEYKEYYCGLAFYLSQIEGFDIANFNIILPHFITWDENMLSRSWEDTTEWKIRGSKVNAFKEYEGDYIVPENISPEDKQKVIDKITFLINRIEDNAHTQIVANCSLLGGYVGAGYIELEEAEDLVHSLIEENSYMQKNIRGYSKTASQMIRRGMLSPIELKNGY